MTGNSDKQGYYTNPHHTKFAYCSFIADCHKHSARKHLSSGTWHKATAPLIFRVSL